MKKMNNLSVQNENEEDNSAAAIQHPMLPQFMYQMSMHPISLNPALHTMPHLLPHLNPYYSSIAQPMPIPSFPYTHLWPINASQLFPTPILPCNYDQTAKNDTNRTIKQEERFHKDQSTTSSSSSFSGRQNTERRRESSHKASTGQP